MGTLSSNSGNYKDDFSCLYESSVCVHRTSRSLNNASVKAPLFPSSMMLFFVGIFPMPYHDSFPRSSYCMNARIPISRDLSVMWSRIFSFPSSRDILFEEGGGGGVGWGKYLLYAVTLERSFASQYKLFCFLATSWT